MYKIGSQIWGRHPLPRPPNQKMAAQKQKNGPNFGQLGNLIANISGMKQDIVERKTALQTAICLANVYLIW